MKEFGCAVRGSPAANSRKQADAHTAPSSTRVASRKALMTPAISALPQLSSGGIEADHVNARELAHRGIEQAGIARIDPPGQVQNDMAVAKRLLEESRRTCLGAKADHAQDSQDRAAEHRLPPQRSFP